MTAMQATYGRAAALALAMLGTAFAGAANAQTPTPPAAQAPAAAQTSAAAPAHPTEFDVMGVYIASTSFGSQPLALLAPSGSQLHVAETTSSLTSGVGLEAHLGRSLTSRLSFEAIGGWTHRQYKTSVSGDIEQAPSVDATIGASRFVIEGAGVYTLHETASANLFALGGLGWVREVAAGNALAQDGALVDFGAGAKYWLGGAASASHHTRYGVRAEGHVTIHRAGITLDDTSSRVTPSLSGGLIIRF
jgi:hypothetical protein